MFGNYLSTDKETICGLPSLPLLLEEDFWTSNIHDLCASEGRG